MDVHHMDQVDELLHSVAVALVTEARAADHRAMDATLRRCVDRINDPDAVMICQRTLLKAVADIAARALRDRPPDPDRWLADL